MRKSVVLCATCLALSAEVGAAMPSLASEPVTILDQPGWCNWCPSPAYLPDGRVALAFSRWPAKFGFETWKAKSEIALAISESGPLGPYEFVGTILPGSGVEGDFDRDVTHNPCLFVDNGKYYLYYMGTNSGDDHNRTSAIVGSEAWKYCGLHQRVGVAVADRVEGPYHRTGKPLFELAPDMTTMSNPAICRMPNGKYLIIVKWGEADGIPRGYPKCRVNHFAAVGDLPLGPFTIVNREIFSVPCANFPGEDPYLWTEGETICCAIHDMGHFYSPEEGALIRFESQDGINWTNKGVLFPRGSVSRLERPAILCGKDGSRLLFAASKPDARDPNSLIVAYPGVVPEVAVDAHGGAAAVPPQGTELFRCQVHRGGGRDTRPDNALETFLWSWGNGVAPEADVRLTRDRVAIALHDPTLMRVGRGIPDKLATANVSELDWAQIRDVDTGSYLDASYSSVRIPTLDSILVAMAGRPDRLLYLDEKGAPPELVAELARKYGVERQIYYTSPKFELVARWQKVVPGGLGMVWLGTWPKDNSAASVARAEKFLEDSLDHMAAAKWEGVSQVQIHIRTDLTLPDPFCPSSDCIRRAIKRLHANGVTAQAFTWTEGDNKDVLRKIWDLGFDNFATDDPLVLFELLPELANRDAMQRGVEVSGDRHRETVVKRRFEH